MTRRAILLAVALAAVAAACSGGKHSHKAPVTIPAPSNVAATGAFHGVSLSWSPVAGAAGYEVFRVRNEDIPGITEQGTPIAVAGTATTIGALPDWVPTSWQIAAVVGG